MSTLALRTAHGRNKSSGSMGAKVNEDRTEAPTSSERGQSRPMSKQVDEVMDIVETQQDDNPSIQLSEAHDRENHGHAAYLSQDLDGDTQVQMTDQTLLADGSFQAQVPMH